MSSLLVDTDIFIDLANNDETAKGRLLDESKVRTLCVSAITVMELEIGCRNKSEQQALYQLLEGLAICPLSEAISALAIELIRTYRLSHGLLIPDALIAATAIANEIDLLSKNQRDYRFIENLSIALSLNCLNVRQPEKLIEADNDDQK